MEMIPTIEIDHRKTKYSKGNKFICDGKVNVKTFLFSLSIQ